MLTEFISKTISKYIIADYSYEAPIIMQLAISEILSNGVKYYAKLTPAKMNKIIEDKNTPIPDTVVTNPDGSTKTIKHHKLTTKELDIAILNMQHEICKNSSISDIENLIAYINRDATTREERYKDMLNTMINEWLEKNKMNHKEIMEILDLDAEEYTELTEYEVEDEEDEE